MWILVALVLKTAELGYVMPSYDKLMVYSTLNECEVSMQDIYDEYKLLKANYPVEVEYKTNDNKQKYIIYTYKPDYTKPKVTTYYHCLKAYKK